MFCEQCGQELPANARFCSKCGNVVKNDAGEEKPAQKHISDRHLNPEWKDNIKEPGTKTQGRGGKILSAYLQKWKNLSSMAQKEKGVWIGSHAGALFLLCLLLAVIGLSGGKKAGKEWDGYLADMEAGKKIKEVRYEEYSSGSGVLQKSSIAQFDMDGRLIFYDGPESIYAEDNPLIEKLDGTLPWKLNIRMDENRLYWNDEALDYNLLLFSSDEGCRYQYDENNKISSLQFSHGGTRYTYSCDYALINGRRLVTSSAYFSDHDVENQYSYDEDGNIICWVQKHSKNGMTTTTYTTNFIYDKAGNLIKISEDIGNATSYYYEYSYDDEGRSIRAGLYKHGSDMDVSWRLYAEDIRQYDDAGNLISSDYRDSGKKRHTTYGENGNKTQEEEIRYDDEGKETGKTVYTYDKEGNLTEEVEYDENGKTQRKVVCTYDKKGNKTREESDTYTVYGNKEYITSKTKISYYDNGSVKSSVTTTYKYEANSDFSVVNQIDASEEQSTYTYLIGRWKVTYYTEEEIEAAQHAKEFKEL
ncbi:MAG: zinc ribbon domain-containing protein [Muribaculaceae bacterium]|nr:zinc ribbon domain-containing protein [Muribaculaceae bacterium]